MKKILLFVSVFVALNSYATNHYYANAGVDTNDGLTPATAQKTITKLNTVFASFAVGDSILFNRGDVFWGSIICSRSGSAGNHIVIAAYGTGALPKITGFTTYTDWTLTTPGVYETTATMVKWSVNMVTLNNVPQAVGRFPNSDAPSNGYAFYSAFNVRTSLTCAALGAVNWTGAKLVSVREGYIIEMDSIISQSGSVITYTNLPSINPRSNPGTMAQLPNNATGNGVFVQNHIGTLDKIGEWHFNNTTKKFSMFFGGTNPASYDVKVSVLDTLINIGTRSYITVANIALEGSNLAAVYFQDASNITVKNCTMNYQGAKGVWGWNTPFTHVQGNYIENSFCTGIDIIGRYASNVTVRDNTVRKTGLLAGMGSRYDDADYKGIYVSVDSQGVISKNIVDSTGYTAIQFQGKNFNVDTNNINYYCFVKDDGGGVYTFDGGNSRTKTNRKIRNNIILNGIGFLVGNANPPHAEAIYSDGGSRGIDILNNSIYNCSNRGIYLNDPKDILVSGNNVYQTANWSVNKHPNDSIYNLVFKNNVFFNTFTITNNGKTYNNSGVDTTTIPIAANIQEALQYMGYIDSNYYQHISATPFAWYYSQTTTPLNLQYPANVSFATWQTFTGHDLATISYPASLIPTQSFEYNATDLPRTIFFTGLSKVDPRGNVFNNSMTLAPFTSAVLMANGSIIVPPTNTGTRSFIRIKRRN